MHARNEEYLQASRVIRARIWTGLLLNESYLVGPLIEQGATTELYDGTEVSTGESVALKILLPQLAEDARTRALFLDEARALRRLSQPGLLRYRSCARDPQSDLTYIVTDLVGMRMSSPLAKLNLSEQGIVDLTRRLALAMAAAHGAGVIHRGLSPHAIALPQGRLSDATITDFNLIKAAHAGGNGAFDNAMVDHDYCAPEQLSNNGEAGVVGPWTDVYSLALVILSALGRQAAGETKAKPDLSRLPRKLQPVFERMLEPKPARRLQTMDEVVKQLDLALGSAPLHTLLAIRLPRFRPAATRESVAPAARPVVPPLPKMPAATPARTAPARAPLPALPNALQPKTVPLGKFHGPRTGMGFGGIARRSAAALSALLLAASPWIIQTSFPQGPADASTVPPSAQVQTAATAARPPAEAARPPAVLPKGQVYGADNTSSRVLLRVHRPTRVIVHSRGNRLLFNRMLQRGDLYRAPTLPDLRVSTEDAGAVEVVLNGATAGFVGQDGAPVQQARLSQFASLAPRPAAPPRQQSAPVVAESPPEAVTFPEAIIEFVPPEEATAQAEPAQPTDQAAESIAASPNTAGQATASGQSAQPPSPPAALPASAPPEQPAIVQAPEPPTAVASIPDPPAPPPQAVIPPPQQQAVVAPPPARAEPESRRSLLERLMARRANRPAAPAAPAAAPAVAGTTATAMILAPSITKEAADRAQAAADRAQAAADLVKAARLEAQRKARADSRERREGAFFNSTLGVNAPY